MDLMEILTQHATWFRTEGASGKRANLTDAYLTGADLTDAYLAGANLTGANLTRANLTDATLPALAVSLPTVEFVAWKKVRGDVILELRIPDGARRTASLVGRKCRADRAHVVSATTLDGAPVTDSRFVSLHDASFAYTVGETVAEPRYDDDTRVECTAGIHFFATRQEAVDYR